MVSSRQEVRYYQVRVWGLWEKFKIWSASDERDIPHACPNSGLRIPGIYSRNFSCERPLSSGGARSHGSLNEPRGEWIPHRRALRQARLPRRPPHNSISIKKNRTGYLASEELAPRVAHRQKLLGSCLAIPSSHTNNPRRGRKYGPTYRGERTKWVQGSSRWVVDTAPELETGTAVKTSYFPYHLIQDRKEEIV